MSEPNQAAVPIVDDQPAVCTAPSVLFELNDIPSLEANSPEEALELAAPRRLARSFRT